MKNRSSLLLSIAIISALVSVCVGFAPATQLAFQPARLVNGSASYKQRILFMSEEKGKEGTEVEVASETPQQPQGTFYDDEVRGALFVIGLLHRSQLLAITWLSILTTHSVVCAVRKTG